MNRPAFYAAGLFIVCFSAREAAATAIPYSDNFNGATTTMLNYAPPGWVSDNGTVDWVAKGNTYGITCFNNSQGCVDLDGSTDHAGVFETAGNFNLLAGHTYELSAEVSGNQRGAPANTLEFGFMKGTNLSGVLKESTVSGIGGSGDTFTLYTLFYTPTTNMSARAFFYDVGGNDDQGPILDNVKMTAVPLPAAAWLMLSGLAALGVVARRRTSAATAREAAEAH
jgi:hypothetical protein